jgi:hypothetical protein
VVAGTTTGCIKVIYILSGFLVRWSDKQLTATSTNIKIPILTATQLPNMSHLILQLSHEVNLQQLNFAACPKVSLVVLLACFKSLDRLLIF